MKTDLPILETLKLLPEVKWDRFCDAGEYMSFFGWIDRPDGKLDFALVKIDHDGAWSFNTSSALHSEDFGKRLGFEGHVPCLRVEDHFPQLETFRKP